MPGGQFEFNSMGIGRLLNQGRLAVPPNQRSYAWEEQHVGALLKDLSLAIFSGSRIWLDTWAALTWGSRFPGSAFSLVETSLQTKTRDSAIGPTNRSQRPSKQGLDPTAVFLRPSCHGALML